jgi:hypothetical protein
MQRCVFLRLLLRTALYPARDAGLFHSHSKEFMMKISYFASLLLALPFLAQANGSSSFSSTDGMLSIPEVIVDDAVRYYNAQLKLDFATGTFTLQSIAERPETIQITPGRTFPLKAMQYATLPGTNFTVHFLGAVEDSRCPIDALCIHPGSVTVGLELLTGEVNGSEFSLTLGLDATTAVREIAGYRLTLLSVTPAPRSDVTVNPNDYEIALRLDE